MFDAFRILKGSAVGLVHLPSSGLTPTIQWREKFTNVALLRQLFEEGRKMLSLRTERAVLIVTGSCLRAEEKDRPLAYWLREQILSQVDDPLFPDVLVVSDFRYLHEIQLSRHPTISIGGPAVNALAHEWLDELPVRLIVDDELVIQMSDPTEGLLQASVWGMDYNSTCLAVSTFFESFVPEFMQEMSCNIHHV